MRKTILALLAVFLTAGCAASPSAASTAAATSAPASQTPTATAAASHPAVSTSQTAPVISANAIGVVTADTADAIEIHAGGKKTSYQKGAGMVADGVIVPGELVYLYTYQDNGKTLVSDAVVASSKTQTGVLKDEAMSTFTISVSSGSGSSDVSFIKNDNYVREDGIVTGDTVIVSYTEDNGSPSAFYLAKKDAASTDMTLTGIIEDAAMSTIQMRSSADGSSRTFLKADQFTASAELVRGLEVRLVFHHVSGSDFAATEAAVNDTPRMMSGKVTAIGMSTVTISVAIGSGFSEYSFLLQDDCVEDENIQEGNTVTVYYERDADDNPQAYAVLKAE